MKKIRTLSPLELKKQQKESEAPAKSVKKETEEKKKDKENLFVATQRLYKPLLTSTMMNVMEKKPEKLYKLKITATDIQCIASTDKDKKDDYDITLSIFYKTKDVLQRPVNRKVASKIDGPNRSDTESVLKYVSSFDNRFPGAKVSSNGSTLYHKLGLNTLIRFEADDPRHVNQGNSRGMKNINNSMTFEITQEELDDRHAEFTLYTRVVELNSARYVGGYKSNNILYNHDGYELPVAIYDVLRILTGKRELNATKPYFDGAIAKGIKFDYFDGTKLLPLTKVDFDKIILEGPIRARGNTSANKAALWVRFELVE